MKTSDDRLYNYYIIIILPRKSFNRQNQTVPRLIEYFKHDKIPKYAQPIFFFIY